MEWKWPLFIDSRTTIKLKGANKKRGRVTPFIGATTKIKVLFRVPLLTGVPFALMYHHRLPVNPQKYLNRFANLLMQINRVISGILCLSKTCLYFGGSRENAMSVILFSCRLIMPGMPKQNYMLFLAVFVHTIFVFDFLLIQDSPYRYVLSCNSVVFV